MNWLLLKHSSIEENLRLAYSVSACKWVLLYVCLVFLLSFFCFGNRMTLVNEILKHLPEKNIQKKTKKLEYKYLSLPVSTCSLVLVSVKICWSKHYGMDLHMFTRLAISSIKISTGQAALAFLTDHSKLINLSTHASILLRHRGQGSVRDCI